jgi:hypothetical protein
MAYQMHIADGELRIRFFGEVAHGDIVDSCVEAAADPRVGELQKALIDFSDMSCCACSTADLSMIASVAGQLSQRAPQSTAVVMVTPFAANACTSFERLRRHGSCVEICAPRLACNGLQ